MAPKHITTNTLFYGDNLEILHDYIADESVDLVYLDPPFNSNRSYNVLFQDESGNESESQIEVFDDTWHWNQRSTAATYQRIIDEAPEQVSRLISALREAIGTNQMMAYLVMMAARLIELHRVLKPTGSLYLHCDPTASHYLKIVMDAVFGAEHFVNEIVWKRTTAHNTTSRKLGDVTDVILFYSKTGRYFFNSPRQGHRDDYLNTFYRHLEPDGRRYRLDKIERNAAIGIRPNLIYEYKGYTPKYGWMMMQHKLEEFDRLGKLVWNSKGRPSRKIYLDEVEKPRVGNLWDDIPPIQASAAERLGYPTQKPLALLERIINASSNPGDVVLDSFCGCGTAIAAARKLGRRWIGIDITSLAIALIKSRLADMFGAVNFDVIGEPEDLRSALQLAQDDRYQFQWWALSLINARPLGAQAGSKAGKKGSDKGIDGVITFLDDNSGKAKRALVQVKSGHVHARDVRDLVGTVNREGAAMGIFVTLEKTTQDMIQEAATAGFYSAVGWKGQQSRTYPKIQLLTVQQLLDGQRVMLPPTMTTFKQAPRVKGESGQLGLLDTADEEEDDPE